MNDISKPFFFSSLLFALLIFGCTKDQNPVSTLPSDLLLADIYLLPTTPSQCDLTTVNAKASNIGSNVAGNFTIEIFNDVNFNSVPDDSELIYSNQYSQLSPNNSVIASIIIDSSLVGQLQFISRILFIQDNNVSNNKLTKLLTVYPCLLLSSFEKNGQPSSDNWSLPTDAKFSNDAPSGGGSYSLELQANAPPEIYAQIKVPVSIDFNNYSLTIWSKSTGVTNNIYGKAILSLLRNGALVQSSSISVDNIIWQSYSIRDSFNIVVGDSFMVQLTAGASQLFSGKTYFDVCKLRAVD